MFTALFGSVEQGIIYAIMALGVYLTFRVLDFPDLTVDGSFVTGAATAATMIALGYNPILATLTAIVAGFIAGCMTGLLHTKGKINPLLSGILMMIALYSINLRIMGLSAENAIVKPNIPLMSADTLFSQFQGFWSTILIVLIITLIIKFITDWFLKTEVGVAIRATGDNKRMIRSFSANTDGLIVLGLGLSNALVAFSGALIAQYSKFADANMGIGMIVIGLASVIIGEAIFGTKTIFRTTLAVVAGAIIYRIIYAVALRIEWLDTSDMKLITAIIVILALIVPQWVDKRREKRRKEKRRLDRLDGQTQLAQGGNHLA